MFEATGNARLKKATLTKATLKNTTPGIGAATGAMARGRTPPHRRGMERRRGLPKRARPLLARPQRTLLATLLLGARSVSAGLLPTEIYYNGPLAGADADEFLEITNATGAAIPLSDFTFAEGVGFTFPVLTLAPGASLVLAPDVNGFQARFPDFSGGLFDVTGGLSNSGEPITLLDATGETVFSMAYDDTAAWPGAADGGGASLELAGIGLPLSEPGSWLAAAPQPGQWRFLPEIGPGGGDDVAAVPAPPAFGLVAAGLLGLGLSRYRGLRTGRPGPDPAKL